ncbi:MAG: DNA repair protein RecO [Clostridiales bacterium]|nr:DNA repair protein RecO [Clostridiales bacterium]
MHFTDDGIVIKNVNIKESDKILVILTKNHGKLKALAPGARGKTSRILAATQLFSYGSFTFFESRGYLKLDSAEPSEQFFELSHEITALSLASYFMELLNMVGDSDVPTEEMLRLTLNALYVLAKLKIPEQIVKPTFELRLMALSGFEPHLSNCGVCKKYARNPMLNLNNGMLHCSKCHSGIDGGISLPVPEATLAALRYVLTSDLKKIFSFKISAEPLGRFYDICEAYVKAQLEHDFSTLSFYNKLMMQNTYLGDTQK